VALTYDVITQELVRFLRSKPGTSEVQPAIMSPAPHKARSLFPFPLPKPPRKAGPPAPTFEIHFTYKGQPRVFRYIIEQADEAQTMINTLRVHTNGELMVRVPNAYGQLMPNEIYYTNRSAVASNDTSSRTVEIAKR